MRKFDKTQDRYYWNQYCKSLTGYPISGSSQHLSVSVSDNGKVDNVILIVKQPEPVAPARPEDAAVETVTKPQPAAATSLPTEGKKGGNIWKWCLAAAGILTGVAILGHHLWKSDRAA